jgi:hypothetical protein
MKTKKWKIEKTCFVAMPIGSGENFQIYKNRYERMIKPAVEFDEKGNRTDFRCVRSDFISKPGSITREILEQLYYSDLVIADLSDLNHNVFYELGVRHGLKNKTILLAHKGTELPFDLKDYRVIWYEDRIGGDDVTIPEIRQFIKTILQTPTIIDSPVFNAIPELEKQFSGESAFEREELLSLRKEMQEANAKIAILEETNRNLSDTFGRLSDPIKDIISKLEDKERDSAQKEVAEAVGRKMRVSTPRFGSTMSVIDFRKVFVVMPYHPKFEDTYYGIKDACEKADLICTRVDEAVSPGTIIDQIYDSITSAGLIIADLTGSNPNIYYEIAVAHTLGKEVLLIARESSPLPFDLASQRVIFYVSIKQLVHTLHNYLVDYKKRFKVS